MKTDWLKLRKQLVTLLISIPAVLLLITPSWKPSASVGTPQGKGGEVVAKPTPTPTPKKTPTTKRPPPKNSRTGQPPKATSDGAAAAEMIFWNSIKDSANPEDFKAYLKKYPSGQFADLAANRMKVLEAPKPQSSPAPTPAPTPEPVAEWPKPERDLPASARVEWEDRQLSFSIPTGWTRIERTDERYLQVNYRAPDSRQTNISAQIFLTDSPHRLKDGLVAIFTNETDLIKRYRMPYPSQRVSAKLTETEVFKHPTGQWQTFTADVVDAAMVLGALAVNLEAVYPDNVWEEAKDYRLSPETVREFNNTRHRYYVRNTGHYLIVLVYTAPIQQFDDKLLPSLMATLRMSGGEVSGRISSSDASVSFYASGYSPEVLIDGELKKREATSNFSIPVSIGKHHIIVRAKDHKPFEQDVYVNGWGDVELEIKLERIVSSTSGAKPE